MRINTRFPVAVHILAVLAYFRGESMPSEIIAKSIGTNPVVVRRIMAQLRKKGLVDTQAGVKGAVLQKEPRDISLLEVYDAVRLGNDPVFDLHPNPCAACPVGEHFIAAITRPLQSAEQATEKELASFTLLDVLKPIMARNGRKLPDAFR